MISGEVDGISDVACAQEIHDLVGDHHRAVFLRLLGAGAQVRRADARRGRPVSSGNGKSAMYWDTLPSSSAAMQGRRC